MAKNWYFANFLSDLTLGGAFTHVLGDSPNVSDTITAASGGGVNSGYYALGSAVNLAGQSNTGSWTVVLNVSAASASTQAQVYLERRNSAGTLQTSVLSPTGYVSTATTGDKTWTWTSPALGTWASGDRLSVRVEVQNNNAHGGAVGPTFSFQAANTILNTPFTLATTVTKTHTTDAVVIKNFLPTHTVSAVVLKTLTRTHGADATVLKTLTRTHSADAVVLKTGTPTHSVDADIFKTLTQSHSVDAVVLKGATLGHSTDAVISAGGSTVTKTHTTDSRVKAWESPFNLVATAISSSAIDLSFEEIPTATEYDIERDSVVIQRGWTGTPSGGRLTFHDTGLSPSTNYVYRVRAVR